MSSKNTLIAAFVFGWLTIAFCGTGFSQSKVQIDENVKVLYHGDWCNGFVVDKDKKKILVEFDNGIDTQRGVFTRQQIRRLYEVDARDYGRTWESAAGTFKINAALKDVIDDQVVLIKEDLTEITVPLSKLSTRDNGYVKKIKKAYDAAVARGQIPAPTPALPDIDEFPAAFASMPTFSTETSNSMEQLGSIPSFLTEFTQAGVGFRMHRKDQDLVAVIPVGGPEQLVLMTARERNWRGEANFQSQLYWVSLKQQKVIETVAITPEDYAIDYDPRTRLLLTHNEQKTFDDTDDPDHFTLWKMDPGSAKAEPIVRWRCREKFPTDNVFGKIINERIVLTKTERKTYEAWDVVDKQGVYWVETQSFFDAPAVLSPDRRYLILPEDGQISVIDAVTGDLVMGAPVDDRHVSGANINPAGTKLAAITERNIYVWDLVSGSPEPAVYPAPLIGSPFSSRLEWIGDDHILGESHQERILYSLDLKLPIWSYRMDLQHYFLNRDPLKNTVVNGMLFYVAEPDPFSGSIAVGAVNLPGPGVEDITKDIDRESLMLLKPGVHVGLDIGNVTDFGKVEQWLIEKIQENEWVLDYDAEIQINAEMGIGKTQTIAYSKIGGDDRVYKVSFRPHFSSLKIKQGDLVIWQTGTRTGAPSRIRARNPQAEIDRYQKPQLNFFKHVKIDPNVMNPKFSRGFGVSKLGLRGIQVVSTSPPGREDDPLAAAAKAQEDQEKAAQEQEKPGNENEEGGTAQPPPTGFGR